MKNKIAALLIPVVALSGTAFAEMNQVDAADLSKGVVVKTVNFRDKPSLSGDKIRYLQSGENIEILDNANAYWYKIKDQNGDIGYVSSQSKYVQVKKTNEHSISEENVALVKRSVNFRSHPSLSGKRIRFLKSGEQLKLIDQVNTYWYKAKDKNGKIGYVTNQSKYISVNAASSQPFEKSIDLDLNIDRIIQSGMKYLGTPYEFGSNRSTVTTFDCSDFVRQAFKEGAGITLPADSRKQAAYVKDIGETTKNWRELKPGDLMFFMSYKGSKKSNYNGINKSKQRITHDGIYLGDGKILHTYSKKSGGVRVDSIEGKHWEHRFVFGGSAIQ